MQLTFEIKCRSVSVFDLSCKPNFIQFFFTDKDQKYNLFEGLTQSCPLPSAGQQETLHTYI